MASLHAHPERGVIRVVVTGSECTGKTTLAEELAAHYGTSFLPEYVREFVQQKGSAPEYDDVDAIARGQMDAEDAHARRDAAILVQDTDLLSTLVYSQHYYGNCPTWIEGALRERAADLYLLTGVDVPWTPDGDQRDRGDRRDEMHQLFLQALIIRNLPFAELGGSRELRLQTARREIDLLTGEAVG